MDSHRFKTLRVVSGPHVSALFDQAVVSGASFLTMIMIGRWTNPVELGLYAIGVSILLSFLAIQQTLISLPYQVQRCSPPRRLLNMPVAHCTVWFAGAVDL